MNGALEFIDTSDFTSMGVGEHFQCTDVEWDPTGRYVITGVSWWGHKVDNAYWMWNFQGKILKRANVDKFCQLTWRPRPPTLLGKDQMRQSKASKELIAKRQKRMDDYTSWRAKKDQEYEDNRARRLELRGGFDADDDTTEAYEEETVEFLVKEESTIMQE